jgi:outer membrane immunogenic protein
MTKGIIFAAAALLGAISSATAADMAVKAPLAPVPVAYNWNGFYVGAMGGYGWGSTNANEYFTNGVFDQNHVFNVSGGFGGGTAGFNYVVAPHFLLGFEGDAAGAHITGSTSGMSALGAATGTQRIDGFATLRGRVGFFWDNVLFYGTGGIGWFDEVSTRTITAATGRGNLALIGQSAGFAATPDTWVAGGGIEWGFAPSWSAKIEYLHAGNLNISGSYVYTPATGNRNVTATTTLDTVKAGINYHFNLWPLTPVVARY